jgi:hypothetical protein
MRVQHRPFSIDPECIERDMIPQQSIHWKNEWFPIDDVTYLNVAAHAAIPRVALNAVQSSVAAQMRPHIVDDRSFFSVAASSSVDTQNRPLMDA